MHMRRTNLSPWSSMTVSAVGESLASVSFGKPWSSLHACSQARQPIHFVISTRMALVLWSVCSIGKGPPREGTLPTGGGGPPRDSRRDAGATGLRQEELLHQLFP